MSNSQLLKDIMAKNIKKHLDKIGKNQTDLAKDLNIPETTVSNWMKANTYPRIDKIQLMADYFGVLRSDLTEDKPDNLYPVQTEMLHIPILGTIACGDPILAAENVAGYRYESVDSIPRGGNFYYLEAKGKSMEPTIPDGSLVLIREQSEVENGEIAAVLLNGDTEATLKRVKKQANIIMLMPDNPNFEPIIVSEINPARIIGKAIRFTVDL